MARPPWYPPSVPSERIARWQGMTIGKGFVARALPTARAPPGNTQMSGDPTVRAHRAPRDAIFRQQDLLLKRGAEIQPHMLERKADIGAFEKRRDPPGQIVDEGAGGMARIREIALSGPLEPAGPVS